MSPANTTAGRQEGSDRELEGQIDEIPLGPREGWAAFISLGLMVLIVGIAIDDARWAGYVFGDPSQSQTRFLPVAALLGVITGTILAKRRIRPLAAHIIGACIGAAYLLYAIAGVVSRATSVEARLQALNLSVSDFVTEVFVLSSRSSETSVFLLVMGAIVWAAGQFSAFAVFRHHRAGPAIVISGLIILLNVSITLRDQYVHLMIFAAAALLLLVRLNLFEQAREWRSRGMRDVGDLSDSFLRNGALMVVFVVVASVALAAGASSAPLARAFSNMDQQLVEVGSSVNRLLGGVSGGARGPNVMFMPTQTIRDFWQSSSEEIFTATVSDGVGRRWRGATYDSFDGRTWQQLDRASVLVPQAEVLLTGTTDGAPTGPGWEDVSVAVTPVGMGGNVFVAPYYPRTVDQPAELLTHGPGGPFMAGRLSYGLQNGVTYNVNATVRSDEEADQLTAAMLASASTDYEPWLDRYLEVRPGSVGEEASATAQRILSGVVQGRRNPYHIAEAVQDYLHRRGGFVYETDLRGACDGQNVVDCFLQIKRGYCEYFATAMVMLLRELGIPSRYVLGYLPGKEQADSSWLVDQSAAHAWVEVYFPGYGWVEFDPTPGNEENGQEITRLPSGVVPGQSAAPTTDPGGGAGGGPPSCQRDPFAPDCVEEDSVVPPAAVAPPPGPNYLPGILLILLTVGLAGLLLYALYRRVPSAEPALAFNSLSRIATRLGYGPQPAQTTYEYAQRLGELVPVANDDLRLIATAKVEATYGRREPGQSTLAMIADAYRRVRVGLLRLIVRRPSGGARMGLRRRR